MTDMSMFNEFLDSDALPKLRAHGIGIKIRNLNHDGEATWLIYWDRETSTAHGVNMRVDDFIDQQAQAGVPLFVKTWEWFVAGRLLGRVRLADKLERNPILMMPAGQSVRMPNKTSRRKKP